MEKRRWSKGQKAKRRWVRLDDPHVVALRACGYSQAEIARFLGVTPAAVSQANRRACKGKIPKFMLMEIKGEKRQALYARADELESEVKFALLALKTTMDLHKLAKAVLDARIVEDPASARKLARSHLERRS